MAELGGLGARHRHVGGKLVAEGRADAGDSEGAVAREGVGGGVCCSQRGVTRWESVKIALLQCIDSNWCMDIPLDLHHRISECLMNHSWEGASKIAPLTYILLNLILRYYAYKKLQLHNTIFNKFNNCSYSYNITFKRKNLDLNFF